MQNATPTYYAPILAVIAAAKFKWQNLRVSLTTGEGKPGRLVKERSEIVLAKIMALEDIESEFSKLPDPPDLTGKKSIFSVIYEEAVFHEGHANFYGERKQTEAAARHRHKRDALNALFEKLSGSAGKQPLTSEEAPATGKIPVTPGPTFHEVSALLSSAASLSQWLENAPIGEIERISEACLESLEKRGAVVHWSLTGI